jgi:hypothetical protein
MKCVISLVFTWSLLAGVPGRANETTGTLDLSKIADAQSWRVTDATAETLLVDGKRAAHLTSTVDSADGSVGLALANGREFSTGTLELDLKTGTTRLRCFVGVVFNVVDTKTFEGVYFRPFNFRTNSPYRLRAVQYVAWPVHTWEHLRKNSPGQYEQPIDPPPDPERWFHAQIDVMEKQVRVFVNHSPKASLTVRRLVEGGSKRLLGLFVDTHDGLYANLQVKATGPEEH